MLVAVFLPPLLPVLGVEGRADEGGGGIITTSDLEVLEQVTPLPLLLILLAFLLGFAVGGWAVYRSRDLARGFWDGALAALLTLFTGLLWFLAVAV